MSVCLSVCLSQVGVLAKWLDGSSCMVFGTEASFDQSYTLLKGNSDISKNLWNFSLNSGLSEKFSHVILIACEVTTLWRYTNLFIIIIIIIVERATNLAGER